jgi:hypothetical protein
VLELSIKALLFLLPFLAVWYVGMLIFFRSENPQDDSEAFRTIGPLWYFTQLYRRAGFLIVALFGAALATGASFLMLGSVLFG